MRRLITKSLILGAVLSLTAGSLVFAVNSTSSTADFSTSSDSKSTLELRLKERETKHRIQLTEAIKKRLVTRCAAAQTILIPVKTRGISISESRTDVYNNILTRLGLTINLLDEQGVDTKELKSIQNQLALAVVQFSKDADNYKTALGDIVTIKCTSDPTGFKATLEALRAQRVQLASGAKDIRSLVPSLKNALSNARQALLDQNKSLASTTQEGGI